MPFAPPDDAAPQNIAPGEPGIRPAQSPVTGIADHQIRRDRSRERGRRAVRASSFLAPSRLYVHTGRLDRGGKQECAFQNFVISRA